ncbi:hypothetical protein OC834_000646 [Tilletia horrida]|nr:hypothetical protein OC834_000646 [Tilletia horrida]
MQGPLQELQRTIAALEEKNKSLQRELKDAKRQIASAEQDSNFFASNLFRVAGALAPTRGPIPVIAPAVGAPLQDYGEHARLMRRVDELTSALATAEAASAAARTRISELQAEKSAQDEQRVLEADKAASLERQVKVLTARLEKATSSRKSCQDRVLQLEAEKRDLEAGHTTQREEIQRLSAEARSARASASQAQEDLHLLRQDSAVEMEPRRPEVPWRQRLDSVPQESSDVFGPDPTQSAADGLSQTENTYEQAFSAQAVPAVAAPTLTVRGQVLGEDERRPTVESVLSSAREDDDHRPWLLPGTSNAEYQRALRLARQSGRAAGPHIFQRARQQMRNILAVSAPGAEEALFMATVNETCIELVDLIHENLSRAQEGRRLRLEIQRLQGGDVPTDQDPARDAPAPAPTHRSLVRSFERSMADEPSDTDEVDFGRGLAVKRLRLGRTSSSTSALGN